MLPTIKLSKPSPIADCLLDYRSQLIWHVKEKPMDGADWLSLFVNDLLLSNPTMQILCIGLDLYRSILEDQIFKSHEVMTGSKDKQQFNKWISDTRLVIKPHVYDIGEMTNTIASGEYDLVAVYGYRTTSFVEINSRWNSVELEELNSLIYTLCIPVIGQSQPEEDQFIFTCGLLYEFTQKSYMGITD